METMPGLASGKTSKSAAGIIEVSAPETVGLSAMRTMQLMSPPHMLNRAPRVLNRAQNSE